MSSTQNPELKLAMSVFEKAGKALEIYSTISDFLGLGDAKYPTIEEIRVAVTNVINELVPKMIVNNEIDKAIIAVENVQKFVSIDLHHFFEYHEESLKSKDPKAFAELAGMLHVSSSLIVDLKTNIGILFEFIQKTDLKNKLRALTYLTLASNLDVFFYLLKSSYTVDESDKITNLANAKSYAENACRDIKERFNSTVAERLAGISPYRKYTHTDWLEHYVIDSCIEELGPEPPFFLISPNSAKSWEYDKVVKGLKRGQELTETARTYYIKMFYPYMTGRTWEQNANDFKNYLGAHSKAVDNDVYFPMDNDKCVYRRDLAVRYSADFTDWVNFVQNTVSTMVDSVNKQLKLYNQTILTAPEYQKTF